MCSNITEIMHFKLNEADFFLDHMIEEETNNNKLHFEYYFSAFTSSLRSVLQYAHKKNPRKHDSLVSNVTLKDYFKDIRDGNIHSKPIETSRLGRAEVGITITVGARMDKENPKETTEGSKEETQQDNDDLASVRYYYIAENQLEKYIDDSLVELCEKYVEEVEEFIANFI